MSRGPGPLFVDYDITRFEAKERRTLQVLSGDVAWDPVKYELGTMAQFELVDNFDTEGSTAAQDGAPNTPWMPLAAETQEEREKLGFEPAHPILQRTKFLKDSAYIQILPNGVRVAYAAAYAIYQHLNRTIVWKFSAERLQKYAQIIRERAAEYIDGGL